MSEVTARVRPAYLKRALGKGFRAAYDNLGFVVLASVCWFVLLALCLTVYAGLLHILGFLPRFIQVGFLLPLLFVPWMGAIGIFHYAQSTVFREEPNPLEALTSIRQYLVPGLRLFVFDLVISLLLIGDAAIMLWVALNKGSLPMASVAFLFVYLTLIWLMSAQLHLPMMVFQARSGNQPNVLLIARESLKIAMQNPVFTLGFLAVIIVFAVVCAAAAGAGSIMLFLGASAFLLSEAFRELLISYGLAEDDPDNKVEDKPWSLPEDWRKRQ